VLLQAHLDTVVGSSERVRKTYCEGPKAKDFGTVDVGDDLRAVLFTVVMHL